MDEFQITNRHIAKLLDRLSPYDIPEKAKEDIKRQMRFLRNDLINLKVNKSERQNNDKKRASN